MLPGEQSGSGALRLFGEGRELNLRPLDSSPIGVNSIRNLHIPRHAAASMRAYAVDRDALRFIIVSGALTLQLPEETLGTPFRIWEDGRRSIEQFVRQTSSP
jgi:hypothetical protein